MKILLIGYLTAYALVMGGMLLVYILVVPAEEKKDDRWWTTSLDALLAAVAFAGMLLLVTGNDSPSLKTAWKIVAPVLTATQLYLNIRGRANHMRDAGDKPDWQTRAGDLGILLFVAPALALNLAYAFL